MKQKGNIGDWVEYPLNNTKICLKDDRCLVYVGFGLSLCFYSILQREIFCAETPPISVSHIKNLYFKRLLITP